MRSLMKSMGSSNIRLVRCHGDLTDKMIERRKILPASNELYVICSTNICETGDTIDPLGYVIDFGWQNVNEHN